jgi:murein DD-endopeptidase MepM/ murein hydrolase activator NlpD
MLGLMGTTGASGAPHLHLDISDSPQALKATGCRMSSTAFRMVRTATNVDEFVETGGTTPALVRPVRDVSRRHQYPVQAAVLNFPRRPAFQTQQGR